MVGMKVMGMEVVLVMEVGVLVMELAAVMKMMVTAMKAVTAMKVGVVRGLLLAVVLFTCFCPALPGWITRQCRKCLRW